MRAKRLEFISLPSGSAECCLGPVPLNLVFDLKLARSVPEWGQKDVGKETLLHRRNLRFQVSFLATTLSPYRQRLFVKIPTPVVKTFQSAGIQIIAARAWPLTPASRFATPPDRNRSAPEIAVSEIRGRSPRMKHYATRKGRYLPVRLSGRL
jgi:hypothetical protein